MMAAHRRHIALFTTLVVFALGAAHADTASKALAKVGPTALPVILPYLESEEAHVRSAAWTAIVFMGRAKTLPALEKLAQAEDGDPALKKAAKVLAARIRGGD